MNSKYKILLIAGSLIACLTAGGAGGLSSRLNLQQVRKNLIKDPSSYKVNYENVFEKNAEHQKLLKKQAMIQLSAGLMAYNDGLYRIAAKHLNACRDNKYVKELLEGNFSVSIEQIIEKCGDVNCPQCLGAKKVDCTKCSGSGWVLCRRCKGTGVSGDFDSTASRTRRRNRNNVCLQCGGLTVVRCDNCGGTGLVNCPELSGFERGTNEMLYDPISNEIKRLLAMSLFLVNGGTDIYSASELKKSITISN